MADLSLKPIGKIVTSSSKWFIKLEEVYIPALQELDGFSHLIVLLWFDECDNDASRHVLAVEAPYKHSPAIMGTFATRSPERPNPIALSVAEIIGIDQAKGMIELAYIDADENSPVIDLKPYTPSLDRVESPRLPEWCRHWPESLEKSASFNWGNEFNF